MKVIAKQSILPFVSVSFIPNDNALSDYPVYQTDPYVRPLTR